MLSPLSYPPVCTFGLSNSSGICQGNFRYGQLSVVRQVILYNVLVAIREGMKIASELANRIAAGRLIV